MRRPSPSSSDSLQVCRDLRAHRSVATRSMPRSRDRPRRQIRRRSSPGSGGPVTPRPPSPWSPVSSSGCRSSGTRTSRARSTPLRSASSLRLRGRPSLWQRRRGTSDSHSALPPSSSESSGRGATWSPLVSRFWRWPFGRSSATPGSPGQPRALDGLRPNGPARNAQRPGPRRIVVVRADGRTTLAPSLPRPRGTPHRGRRPLGRGGPPLARRPTRTVVADRPREAVVSGRAGVSSHPRRHRRRMPPCAVAPWCRVRRTSPRRLDFVERPVAGARRVRSHRGVAVGVAPEPTFRGSPAPRRLRGVAPLEESPVHSLARRRLPDPACPSGPRWRRTEARCRARASKAVALRLYPCRSFIRSSERPRGPALFDPLRPAASLLTSVVGVEARGR